MILFLLTLLLTSPAAAGEPPDTGLLFVRSTATRTDNQVQTVIEFSYDKKTWVYATGFPDCLAQLRAAMEAMEPYIDKWILTEDGNIQMRIDGPFTSPSYFSTDTNDPRMKQFWKERNERYAKALKLWDAANGCGR